MAASEYDADRVARGFVGPLALLAPMTSEVMTTARDGMAEELRRAYAAGRDAGIEEAAQACDRLVRENRALSAPMYASSAEECAEAVRALKGGDRG